VSIDRRAGDIDLAVLDDVSYRVDARSRSGEERVLVPVTRGRSGSSGPRVRPAT